MKTTPSEVSTAQVKSKETQPSVFSSTPRNDYSLPFFDNFAQPLKENFTSRKRAAEDDEDTVIVKILKPIVMALIQENRI